MKYPVRAAWFGGIALIISGSWAISTPLVQYAAAGEYATQNESAGAERAYDGPAYADTSAGEERAYEGPAYADESAGEERVDKGPAYADESIGEERVDEGPAYADESVGEEPGHEEPAYTIEGIEVIASPIIEANSVTLYGSQITTLTEKQLAALSAQDLPSALRRAPGVNISRHNFVGSFGGGEGGSISIRGMGSARPGSEIQTLVNGVPRYIGIWTHPLMDVLSIDAVERVEIYKGGQPVFLGNMSYGGVNLITKQRRESGIGGMVSVAYGSFNTLNERVEHGGRLGRLDYYLVQSLRASDGHRPRADGELQSYYGRIGYGLTEGISVSLRVDVSQTWARDPGAEAAPTPEREKYSIEDRTYLLEVANSYGVAEGHLKVYLDDGEANWQTLDDGPVDDVSDYENYGVRFRQNLHLWPQGELVLGLDQDYVGGSFQRKRPDIETGRVERHFSLTSPYLALRHIMSFSPHFHVTPSAGIRYHRHSAFDDLLGYQVGVLVDYHEVEFHASYARSLNYPGVYVVVQYDQWNAGNTWEELTAEQLAHTEAGLSIRPAGWLEADVTIFRDAGEERIEFVAPPPPPPHYENVGDFTTRGVEVTTALRPIPAIKAFAGGTYLDSEPDALPNTPELTINAGVSLQPFSWWMLHLDSEYVSENYKSNPRFPGTRDRIDPFFLVNGKMSIDLRGLGLGVPAQLFVAGENLTDTEYEHKRGYPMPGVSGMVGLELNY